jgi:hypothetical protein
MKVRYMMIVCSILLAACLVSGSDSRDRARGARTRCFPFFRGQFGPFFDTGAIADPSEFLGSQKWHFDSGFQRRIRVLGSVSVLLSYGRDLRSGAGVFYGTSVY